ncbi:alpha-2-macroglobulin family protein [Paracoccus onubensis]|uniref:alpha-2-macroglobulin family protein n=1 Tax=Paracoccus onubensis TaxID=1675788 RepID=UPI0027319988|nr:alpha-2-macroglobulin family protein [Paracoccus onubensis]MDP0927396.1 alpha-2-macroglobulin family protein [Paracoccus onubensis]
MHAIRWVVSILVLLTGLGTSAIAQDGRRIDVTEGADYFGFDLRTEKDVTLDQCKAICLDDSECRAFTYNTNAEWCFLKSDFTQANPADEAVAGKVVIAGAAPDLGAPPPLRFLTRELQGEADDYRRDLLRRAEPGGAGLLSSVDRAERLLAQGSPHEAMAAWAEAVAIDPEESRLWSGLAQATVATEPNNETGQGELERIGVAAAVNAYQTSRSEEDRAAALEVMAAALERRSQFRPAISAYEAAIALRSTPELQEKYADLKRRKGFRVLDHSVDSDSAVPRVCVQFSEPLLKSGVDYAQFVTVDNSPGAAVERSDQELCVTGLKHGGQYRVNVRQGLPSAVDEVLAQSVSLEIYIRDRGAALRFTGDNFVLPSSARRGIPLISVNADEAELSVYRVGDRALTQLLGSRQFPGQLNGYNLDYLMDEIGEPVWSGTVEIASELNRDVTTSIPIDEAVPERKPGIYLMTAKPTEALQDDSDELATQWFLVSDIGLSTFAGQDGLTVFARSLASATPLEGVTLRLLARNNEVLGEVVTDAQGQARFEAGQARGTDGLAPAALMARDGDEDFVFLDMTRAGFDLSDRGVTGRDAPGPLDVFTWTERGIYRAGEVVHVAALARDPSSQAVDDLPLTFIFRRPDGAEARRSVSKGEALGGHAVDLELPENAMRGTWRLSVYTDPDKPAVAEQMFLVEDFVPDRTEITLSSDQNRIAVGDMTDVTVDGRYLYGAPASGLALEGELSVFPVRSQEDYPGYVFGLDDEDDVGTIRLPLTGLPPTDPNGQAVFPVSLDNAPATTRLLGAEVSVRMREAGGRAVERSLPLEVEPLGPMIGLRPEFGGGSVPEGGSAAFRVIAVNAEGERIAMDGLHWSLYRIERHYQWYRDGGSWNYEPITTSSLVQDGTIDAHPDSEAQISVPVDWGRYRLEVEGQDMGGPISSAAFDSGWYVEASSTETPDGLEVALDRDSYDVGDTARLQISPRFAGEALITIGSDSLIQSFTETVPETGAEIDIPVTEEFGSGVYVTVTLFRPGSDTENRLPMRSIGLRWLKVDPGKRSLAVDLDLDQQIQPDQQLSVPVKIDGLAAGEDAYVTVAAVDVGILNLTRYEAPNPEGWYFSQRKLGLELRDIYGRLIDGSLGAQGRIRTGGDGATMESNGSPPTETLLASFSGIVPVDADGRAQVSFDIPDFNGTARVMAVAWSADGIGHATGDVVIREPLVLTTSLPRFLAPGDQTRILLEIANTDGPAGDYSLNVETTGLQLTEADPLPETLTLDAGEKIAVAIPVTASGTAGEGRIDLSLTHDSGLSVRKTVSLPVRPGVMPVTTREQMTLAANGGSIVLDRQLLADRFSENAAVSVNVSRNQGFDIPALLMALDRYPYGCAEQTTSRALPLLYVNELAAAAGMENDPQVKERVDDAIAKILSYQSSAGSFGMWSPGSGDLWLDAYVTDFLTRASEQGFTVPEQPMAQALRNLQNSVAYDTDVESRGSEIAYALYVLARNRKASAGDLRYYLDTRLDEFSTPMARAQLAAAMGLYGDGDRAANGFASSLLLAREENEFRSRSDYGSPLRDGAAMLALAAETRPEPGIVPEMIGFVGDLQSDIRYQSTQDQAWMLLAARAMARSDDDLSLTVNGTAHEGGFAQQMDGAEISATPVTITNRDDQPVTATVTTVASPREPLPAGGDGFGITRSYYTLDGQEADVTAARQNERYVVVLEVTQDNDWPSRVLVSDLLPAGFEIDNPRLVDSAQLDNFGWLGGTDAAHTEFRDDRFIAAFDRNTGSDRSFRLAYVVRAVSPGVYMHPAASVEDMYRPQLSARTASGFMEVREN